jgi:hypothetical protein
MLFPKHFNAITLGTPSDFKGVCGSRVSIGLPYPRDSPFLELGISFREIQVGVVKDGCRRGVIFLPRMNPETLEVPNGGRREITGDLKSDSLIQVYKPRTVTVVI